ncbi:hypothetical protein ACYOEI_02505 [Singulisphaera rosea]
MNVERSSPWLVAGSTFRLAPLNHRDLDRLYRRRLLPMARPLRARFDKLVFEDDRDEAQAVEALHRCLESFRAVLATSLRKAQPWLSQPEAEILVAIYCGDADGREDDVTLFREVQILGKSTLDGLESQHRERLTELVALAADFETFAKTPRDTEG